MQGHGGIIWIRRDWRLFFQQCSCWKSSQTFRAFSTSRSGHYDTLGLTPAATQADIKSAYYKLSMQYHPDKCTEEAAKGKFRSITEAYEILGNVRLKKLYDKGLLSTQRSAQTYEPEKEPIDPMLKFYKSRDTRNKVPTMKDGSTPVYDFDAWTKHHYADTMKRKAHDKEQVRRRTEERTLTRAAASGEFWYFTAMFALIFGLAILTSTDHDTDQIGYNSELKNSKIIKNESNGRPKA